MHREIRLKPINENRLQKPLLELLDLVLARMAATKELRLCIGLTSGVRSPADK